MATNKPTAVLADNAFATAIRGAIETAKSDRRSVSITTAHGRHELRGHIVIGEDHVRFTDGGASRFGTHPSTPREYGNHAHS